MLDDALKDILSDIKSESPHRQIQAISKLRGMDFHDIQRHEHIILQDASPWLVRSIQGILRDKLPSVPTKNEIQPVIEELDLDSVRSLAIFESIGQMIHELSPVVGLLKVHAKREVENFQVSKTKDAIERLVEVIETFKSWMVVEQDVKISEFNLYQTVADIAESCFSTASFNYVINIPKDLEVSTDLLFFKIILSNAIRNAIESMEQVNGRVIASLLINGNITDKSFWLSVIDNGIGFEGSDAFLRSRYTTKPGHQGFGLALINKAVSALGGTCQLRNGSLQGAEFIVEIPLRRQR